MIVDIQMSVPNWCSPPLDNVLTDGRRGFQRGQPHFSPARSGGWYTTGSPSTTRLPSWPRVYSFGESTFPAIPMVVDPPPGIKCAHDRTPAAAQDAD